MTAVEYIIEDALAAIVIAAMRAAGEPVAVVTGVSDAAMEDNDGVLVHAESAETVEPLAHGCGNLDVSVSVKVFSNFADRNVARDVHFRRVNIVRAALASGALIGEINAASGAATAYGYAKIIRRSTETMERCWVHTTTIIIPSMDGVGG